MATTAMSSVRRALTTVGAKGSNQFLLQPCTSVTYKPLSTSSTSIIKADAVIVGSGVIGSAIACELSRKGWKTINVDKLATAGAGSTGYSSSIIRTYYSAIELCRLALEGFHYYQDWENHIGVEDEAGIAKLTMCGGLIIESPMSASFLAATLPSLDTVGVPYEYWSLDKIKEHYSWNFEEAFGPPKLVEDESFGDVSQENAITGAYFFPDVGYVNDPMLAARNLMTAAKAAGGKFLFNRKVVDALHASTGQIEGVVLDDGTRIEAPVVVNAAGPHSSNITDLIFSGSGIDNDMKLSTKALRQEVAYVDMPAQDKNPGHVVMDMDTGVYMRPDIGNKFLIGGIEPECDDLQWVNADDYETNLTDHHSTHLYRAALRNPELEITQASKGIVALYDVTEDWTPIYDRSSIPGYYMAIGTSGNQFKNAGVVGAMMAELIEQTENGSVSDAQPLQFKLKYLDSSINTQVFSRKRQLNDSSGSVLG